MAKSCRVLLTRVLKRKFSFAFSLLVFNLLSVFLNRASLGKFNPLPSLVRPHLSQGFKEALVACVRQWASAADEEGKKVASRALELYDAMVRRGVGDMTTQMDD